MQSNVAAAKQSFRNAHAAVIDKRTCFTRNTMTPLHPNSISGIKRVVVKMDLRVRGRMMVWWWVSLESGTAQLLLERKGPHHPFGELLQRRSDLVVDRPSCSSSGGGPSTSRFSSGEAARRADEVPSAPRAIAPSEARRAKTGAGGGTRTRTSLRKTDFKSVVYTYN